MINNYIFNHTGVIVSNKLTVLFDLLGVTDDTDVLFVRF